MIDPRDIEKVVRELVLKELGTEAPAPGRPAQSASADAATVAEQRERRAGAISGSGIGSSARAAGPGAAEGASSEGRGNPPDMLAYGAPSAAQVELAKKVAAWLGTELPPPPWFGDWRPSGDRAYYLGRTPARLGVGRAGTRYRTDTVLSFLADHAAARDAVWSDLSADMLKQHKVIGLTSAAKDKREFLARPDLGRRLSAESLATVQREGERGSQVQIVIADGLSAAACNTNVPLVLPVLEAELKRAGLRIGRHFAISNGRVACADEVARTVGADLLCLLVGERPGLKTAESMGAYVTYMKVRGFNEAMRSVISNIHKGGLVPERGALDIAALCIRGLKEKRTGMGIG